MIVARIKDRKFRELRGYFLVQSAAAVASVMLLMLLVALIDSEVVVAAIGASVFIAVSAPHAKTSRARHFIGGYACGILAGVVGFLLTIVAPGFPA
jgi:ABC-type enterobactin transport system permease subunit